MAKVLLFVLVSNTRRRKKSRSQIAIRSFLPSFLPSFHSPFLPFSLPSILPSSLSFSISSFLFLLLSSSIPSFFFPFYFSFLFSFLLLWFYDFPTISFLVTILYFFCSLCLLFLLCLPLSVSHFTCSLMHEPWNTAAATSQFHQTPPIKCLPIQLAIS